MPKMKTKNLHARERTRARARLRERWRERGIREKQNRKNVEDLEHGFGWKISHPR